MRIANLQIKFNYPIIMAKMSSCVKLFCITSLDFL